MRISILGLFIYTALSLNVAFGQSSEKIIKEIRAEYNRINDSYNLKLLKLSNEDFMEHMTDGGGTLVGYFEDGKLVKFVEWIGFSFGNQETEYYLKNGKLFFSFRVLRRFVDKEGGYPGDLDYTKLEIALEGRYYFNSGELIKMIEKGPEKENRVFSSEFDATEFSENASLRAQQLRDHKAQTGKINLDYFNLTEKEINSEGSITYYSDTESNMNENQLLAIEGWDYDVQSKSYSYFCYVKIDQRITKLEANYRSNSSQETVYQNEKLKVTIKSNPVKSKDGSESYEIGGTLSIESNSSTKIIDVVGLVKV